MSESVEARRLSRLYVRFGPMSGGDSVGFVKRLVLWLVLSLPIGVVVGATFSAFLGQGADLDRFTSGGNGALAGAWVALVGALAAAGTISMARPKLKKAGGSEFLTGLVVSYGLIIVALGLLRLLA